MALRRRPRGLAPAVVGSLALVLAACGASSAISPDLSAPATSITPNACDLLSDSDAGTAMAAPSAASSSGSSGAGGAASATPTADVKHVYSVTKMSLGGTKQVGQCVWTNATGAEVIALVIPNTQLSTLADYTAGATKVGAAYIQQSGTRGFVSVQHGSAVIAITLVLDADSATRTARLADLARTASGAAIPSVTAAPSTSAATSSSAVASGPGQQVSGQTASAKVKETDQLQFSPTSVTVKAGQVLEWDNTGQIAHNVTFDAYSSISSDTMNGGDTYQVKFTQPGTYQFHCTFHPGMEGTVTVQ